MDIDYERLRKICNAEIPDFYPLGNVVDTGDGVYIFREGVNSKVLAVAHLDTVLNSNYFQVCQAKKKHGGGLKVYSRQLDDRLGVYTILDLLPQLGIEYDLLLTEGEETGRSTAQYFATEKEYNWAFSFDRRGEDAVSYQFEDEEWNTVLEKAGFRIGMGSFSDIAFLDDLKVKCVNIGTGYHGEHTHNCHANMAELERQVLRFKDFYEVNKDVKFPHTHNPNWWKGTSNYSYRWEEWETTTITPMWGRWKYKFEYVPCWMCQEKEGVEEIEDGILVCMQCFAHLAICTRCSSFVLDTELMHGICKDCMFDEAFGKDNFNGYREEDSVG